jgi:hypothetical protein
MVAPSGRPTNSAATAAISLSNRKRARSRRKQAAEIGEQQHRGEVKEQAGELGARLGAAVVFQVGLPER